MNRAPRRLMPWVSLLILYVAAMLVFAWSRVQYRQYEYWIADAMARQQVLRERSDKLNIELATVRTPARLEAAARRLGMTRPEAGRIVNIR